MAVPNRTRTRGRGSVLVLTYWSWPDALIQTYTLPYLRQIRAALPPEARLYLLTMEQRPMAPAEMALIRNNLRAEGIHWLALRYRRFGPRMALRLAGWALWLWALCLRERFQALHAWCMPAGGLGYILSRLTGIPLHMDSYEPHAEATVENGSWQRGSLKYRLLAALERRLTQRASVLISCTEGYLAAAPGLFQADFSRKRCFVKAACTDLTLFHPDLRKDPALMHTLGYTADHRVLVYAGKFGGIYLEQEAFQLMQACYRAWGERLRILLLTHHPAAELEAWRRAAGLPDDLLQTRFVPFAEVPRYMGLGDVALSIVKPIPSKRYCTPIKDGEYWALGLPILSPPHISDDSALLVAHRAGVLYDPYDAAGHPAVLRQLEPLLQEDPTTRTARIRGLAERYRNFAHSAAIYQALYG